MRTANENGKVVVYLEGMVNSTNAPQVQQALREALAANPESMLEIDAGALEFISSAGLRLLQQIRKSQGSLTVRNVTPEIYDILNVTGFINLLEVKRKLREFSVEGCPIVGRGAIGTVYRVDEDTIVKVYENPDSLPMIENEQRRAKQAFLKGIPTAISYDVVKVGDRYGSVFEMLKAATFNDLVIRHPEKLDDIVRRYARFIRELHAVEMDRGALPEARAVFLDYLDALRDILPGALNARLRSLFVAMPENLHVVHGDIQMKNVMFNGDEPLVIDMDTLSVGDPVFDLMGLYMVYVQFNEDEPTNSEDFLGIPAMVARAIWEKTMRCYFEDLDESALKAVERKIIVVALVRFLYLVGVRNVGRPELKQVRIDNAIERLCQLADRVDSLEVTPGGN